MKIKNLLGKNKQPKQLRLKDLSYISQDPPIYAPIMKMLGMTQRRFLKKRRFKKYFLKAHVLVNEAQQVDPKLVRENPDCEIKRPVSIDNITFKAMMELQSMIGNSGDKDTVQLIIETITKACYSANVKGEYHSNTEQYLLFRDKVSNAPLYDMLGLFNWIDEALTLSEKSWAQRFLSVEVIDKDYEQAGGQAMAQFNIISTIKGICNDFNLSYEEAWQISYALSQTNSYSKATANYIQDEMRKLKEIEMKRQRGRQS